MDLHPNDRRPASPTGRLPLAPSRLGLRGAPGITDSSPVPSPQGRASSTHPCWGHRRGAPRHRPKSNPCCPRAAASGPAASIGCRSPAPRAPGTNRPSDAGGKANSPPKPTPLRTRHFSQIPARRQQKPAAAGCPDPQPARSPLWSIAILAGCRDVLGRRMGTVTCAGEPMCDPPSPPRRAMAAIHRGLASGCRGTAAA